MTTAHIAMTWTKDECAHYLEVPQLGGYYTVVKAPADWYYGFNPEGSPCIEGDIEYADSWQEARKKCEEDMRERLAALAKAGAKP